MSWVITGIGAPPQLLDAYPGAAAAYSLRSLSLAYGGPVVRVRRSSDNTEQDFTAAQVTNGTLATFCGAGNGFVRTWYDQSGTGRNATQTSTLIQPSIVSSGTLITTNGKPALEFANSGSSNLSFSRASDIGSVFGVYKCNDPTPAGGAANFLIGDIISFDYHAASATWLDPAVASAVVKNGSNYLNSVLTNFTTTNRTSDQYLISMIHTSAAANASAISQDRTVSSSRSWRGTIQELLLYPSLQTANRSGIESNINSHFTIY
jgi:hypothetical protein